LEFDINLFWHALTSVAFARGAAIALILALVSHAFAILISLVLAQGLDSRWLFIRGATRAYVAVFRAVPLLLVLLFIWNGFPQISPIFREEWFSPFLAAFIGLSFVEAAYQVEINRAALQAVNNGQREAGAALGLRPWQVSLLVIFPQALRVATPPTMNEFITLLKSTSLATVISLQELMTVTQQSVAVSFKYAEYYAVAVVYYVAIVLLLSAVQSRFERRFSWNAGHQRREVAASDKGAVETVTNPDGAKLSEQVRA
jgi:His/Glu/Gln/Arg/opine family amino acid ABC transporter permease subunit